MYEINIYTDGACSVNVRCGGWAAIIITPNERFNISGSKIGTTNNAMELMAVIQAIEECLDMKEIRATEGLHLKIYSDSAYVVNGVNHPNRLPKWRLNGFHTVQGDPIANKELWIKMVSFLQMWDLKLELIKVKGHSGNRFNTKADKLASGRRDEAKRKLERSKGYKYKSKRTFN